MLLAAGVCFLIAALIWLVMNKVSTNNSGGLGVAIIAFGLFGAALIGSLTCFLFYFIGWWSLAVVLLLSFLFYKWLGEE